MGGPLDETSRVKWWFGLLTLLPALATASVWAEAFLASRALGHWPTPSLEDPKDLVTAPLHVVSALLVLAMLPGALFLLAVCIKNWRALSRASSHWLWLAVFATSLAVHVWVVTAYPRTWEWWWD